MMIMIMGRNMCGSGERVSEFRSKLRRKSFLCRCLGIDREAHGVKDKEELGLA
jgi:hypothetical protein